MKVSYKEFSEQERIINSRLEKFAQEQGFNDGKVACIQNTASFRDPIIQMGVNHYLKGCMKPEETIAYAKVLLKAVKEAKNFKYNGYEVWFEKD